MVFLKKKIRTKKKRRTPRLFTLDDCNLSVLRPGAGHAYIPRDINGPLTAHEMLLSSSRQVRLTVDRGSVLMFMVMLLLT